MEVSMSARRLGKRPRRVIDDSSSSSSSSEDDDVLVVPNPRQSPAMKRATPKSSTRVSNFPSGHPTLDGDTSDSSVDTVELCRRIKGTPQKPPRSTESNPLRDNGASLEEKDSDGSMGQSQDDEDDAASMDTADLLQQIKYPNAAKVRPKDVPTVVQQPAPSIDDFVLPDQDSSSSSSDESDSDLDDVKSPPKNPSTIAAAPVPTNKSNNPYMQKPRSITYPPVHQNNDSLKEVNNNKNEWNASYNGINPGKCQEAANSVEQRGMPPESNPSPLLNPYLMDDDELGEVAFFGAKPHAKATVNMYRDEDRTSSFDVEIRRRPQGTTSVDVYHGEGHTPVQNVQIREGLRSAKKSPSFLSRPGYNADAFGFDVGYTGDSEELEREDIETYSDDEAVAFGFSSRPSMSASARRSYQPPANSDEEAEVFGFSSRPPMRRSTGTSYGPSMSAPGHSGFESTFGGLSETRDIRVLNPPRRDSSGQGPTRLSDPWKERSNRRPLLRDAVASNTANAAGIVKKPGATHNTRAAVSSSAPADSFSNNSRTFGGWSSQPNVRAGDENVRNELVNDGVGLGGYQFVRGKPASKPRAKAAGKARRGRGKGSRGGWKRKKAGGSKRGGSSRRGGRGGSRRGGRAASSFGDAGGSGGAWGQPPPTRDDPNLRHVGGAEMSF